MAGKKIARTRWGAGVHGGARAGGANLVMSGAERIIDLAPVDACVSMHPCLLEDRHVRCCRILAVWWPVYAPH